MEIDLNKLPEELNVEQYIVIALLHNKEFNLLDNLYSNNKILSGSMIQLELKLYIKFINSCSKTWILREKGLALFPQKSEINLAEKIRDLFPKGVKSGGYLVKSSISDIEDKLKKFTKKYKYSDTIIIEATKCYVEEFKKQGYNYMLLAKYFISKEDKGSTLADYCEMIINNEVEEKIFIDTV